MKNRSYVIVRRWAYILGLGLIGGVAYGYFAGHYSSLVAIYVGVLFGSERGVLGDVLCIGVATLLIVLLHHWACIRLRHARHVLQYPPFAMAVVVGLFFAVGLPRLLESRLANPPLTLGDAVMAAAFYLLIWFAQTLFCYWVDGRPVSSRLEKSEGCARGKLSDSDLRAWLQREESVAERSLDMFGHAEIADRLVDRLMQGESTIALQGAFGSGKSSICRMAEREAQRRQEKLIFVYASCWGFEDPEGAQKHVLEAILSEVSHEVDSLAIRQLPADYLDSISSEVGWLRSLLHLGRREQSPVEQLQRLSPILGAINRKVVLVVEDVDRTGQDFDIGRIQALLMQFREVPGISFILAISPLQQVDFAKLCEHLEIIPPLERHQVLELIDHVRELALREYLPGIILSKLDPLILGDGDYQVLNHHLEYFWPWQLSLCGVLNRPRLLKHAMRRVIDAWAHLHGEVHLDHLVSVAALRAGAPSAFAFLCDRFPLFAPASKKPDSNLREDARIPLKEDLRKEWKELCATGHFDALAVGGLLRDIYPLTSVVTGLSAGHSVIPQSAQSDSRGQIYARRLFTERTESHQISDQKILKLMQESKSGHTATAALAEAITTDRFASVAFEYFARTSRFENLLPLLTEVYACIRRSSSADADLDGFPGFFSPWRLVGEFNRPEGFDDWLVEELGLCVRTHLRLLTNIYYYWLGTDRHTRTQRERAREATISALRAAWKTMRPEEIAASFGQGFPYVLFHLIFTSDYPRPDQVPFGAITDWAWTGPILLRAAQVSPNLVLPQILVALNNDSTREGPDIRFELDQAKLDAWFGPANRQILQLAAAGFHSPPEMTEQYKYLMKIAIESAKLALSRMETPAAASSTPKA